MRGTIPGLPSRHPLGSALPAIYQEDDLAQRLTAALDEVLAPVFCTLDNRDAYLDPQLTPPDFLAWLAGWLGISLDETWPQERQRALVATAGEVYQWRGTRRGLAAQVALYTSTPVDVDDSGGTSWSPTPGGAPRGRAESQVTVRVHAVKGQAFDMRRLEAIVDAAKPAHVPHHIKVVRT